MEKENSKTIQKKSGKIRKKLEMSEELLNYITTLVSLPLTSELRSYDLIIVSFSVTFPILSYCSLVFCIEHKAHTILENLAGILVSC